MKNLEPPGETTRIQADGALIVAPHFDDEVLGCGGLAAQLAAGGARVRVLFLTDGTADPPAGEAAADYAARRREEAERAARVLGVTEIRAAELPDGRLADHLEPAAEAIRQAIVDYRPDLLLVPSPLEASADHRAAFAALHRLLAPLRGETDLDALARELMILAYEVNHPGHPDLLVDVSRELRVVERAMACYASQQERRDYLGAYLGRARFRTLTLPRGVQGAEGYRRLGLADFTTRSPAQLVAHLGGVAALMEVREGPRISVVVRTRDRPALLGEALASLAAGTYRRAEVVLVNDGGAPPEPPADFPLPLVRVDLPENRGRAAAAQAGVEAAGGDWIAFLDDDDLAAPEHLATLAGLVSAPEVRVAYTDAAVGVYELDGGGWKMVERRLPYSRDFAPEILLVDNYIPFNTVAIERRLFAEVGPFDAELPFFEDWDFLIRLSARVGFHHLRRVTCEYRHFRGGAHHALGGTPRQRPDFLAMKTRVLAKHAGRLEPPALARAVDTLRAELVEQIEAVAATRRETAAARRDAVVARWEADGLRRARAELEGRYHRLNGEVQALRGERRRLLAEAGQASAELARLYGEEERLNRDLGEQGDHLARTYAEIERLNALLREMESTRAWRLHQWWQRRFS